MSPRLQRGVKGRHVYWHGAEWKIDHVFKNGKLKIRSGAYTHNVSREDVAFMRGDYRSCVCGHGVAAHDGPEGQCKMAKCYSFVAGPRAKLGAGSHVYRCSSFRPETA